MYSAENSSIESPAASVPPSTRNYYNNTNTEIQNSHSCIVTDTSSELNMVSIYS